MTKCNLRLLCIFITTACFSSKGQQQNHISINGTQWESTCFNAKKYVDDRDLAQAKSKEDWQSYLSSGTPAWCYAGFSSTGGNNDPVFYNKHAIAKSNEIIPRSHRLPSKADFESLIRHATDKGEYTAGVHLKADNGWIEGDIYAGDDKSKFGAEPSGWIVKSKQSKVVYEKPQEIAAFWMSRPSTNESALLLSAHYSHAQIAGHIDGGYCIRLIKKTANELEQPDMIVAENGVKWATSNVDRDTYLNSDPIPYASTEAEWDKYCSKGVGAYTYLNHDEGYKKTYGKIYNIHAVEDKRGLAPEGWRLPTKEEVSDDRHESVLRTSFYKSGTEGGYRETNEFTNSTEKASFFMQCYKDEADQPDYRICVFNLYTTMSRTTGSYTGGYLRLVKD